MSRPPVLHSPLLEQWARILQHTFGLALVVACAALFLFVPRVTRFDLRAHNGSWGRLFTEVGLSRDQQNRLGYGHPVWRKTNTWYIGLKDTGIGFDATAERHCSAPTCAGPDRTYGTHRDQVARVAALFP